ncbi:Hypothetical protein A7982_07127 [Minicystis rosea]|nr:Hypothetical protein A7982_07127 [Minicystis rosea]
MGHHFPRIKRGESGDEQDGVGAGPRHGRQLSATKGEVEATSIRSSPVTSPPTSSIGRRRPSGPGVSLGT